MKLSATSFAVALLVTSALRGQPKGGSAESPPRAEPPAKGQNEPASAKPDEGRNAGKGGNQNAPGEAKKAGKGDENAPGTPAGVGNRSEENKGLSDNASANAKAVQAVLEKFKTQRDQYLAERKALLDRLKTASENEKKAILEQLRAETRAREEEERATAKQIREEMKKLREERKGGG